MVVIETFERWQKLGQPSGKPDILGVDVARGGADKTVLAPRFGSQIGKLLTFPGSTTPDGPTVRALVLRGVFLGRQAELD